MDILSPVKVISQLQIKKVPIARDLPNHKKVYKKNLFTSKVQIILI